MATTKNDRRIEEILGDVDFVSRSLPECLIALNQNMKPIEINSITNASWSARAAWVEYVRWHECDQPSSHHACGFTEIILCYRCDRNTVNAPKIAGKPSIAYRASSPSIGSKSMETSAIDHVNSGGLGLTTQRVGPISVKNQVCIIC